MGSARSLKVFMLAGVLALAGCAALDSAPMAPDAAWFEARLAAGEYAQAGAALLQWRGRNADDPQLVELAGRLDTATAQLRDAAISDARALREQQRWGDADQRLLTALQQVPDDAALKSEYAAFDTAREQQRRQALHAFDIDYARSLPQLLQHAHTVFELKPQDLNAAAQLKSLQESANAIALRLTQDGRRQQRDGEIAAAAQSFQLAAQLAGDAALERQAQQLQQELTQAAKPARKHIPRQSSSALADALATLDAALDNNQFDVAQPTLETLQAKYPGNAQVQQRVQRYESQRREFVGNAIEQGKRYYSSGDLGKAIETWESAYLLDPGNEDLRDRIDRAQRFRSKVESLQR